MVAGSFSVEIESSVDETRLWNAMVKDGHNILPRTAPDICAGVTLLEGDGGVGNIGKINFASAGGSLHEIISSHLLITNYNYHDSNPKKKIILPWSSWTLKKVPGMVDLKKKNYYKIINSAGYEKFSYVERVDEVDEDNLVFRVSHMEGGVMRNKFASAQFVVSFSPRAEGGCITTFTCHYDSLPGIRHNDAKIKEMKSNSTRMFMMIEAYLIDNPTLYS